MRSLQESTVSAAASAPPAALRAVRDQLQRWLIRDAYPLWWRAGADPARGGFFERVSQDGHGLPEPRRARLHPRQMYAFSYADFFGCERLSAPAVTQALSFHLRYYQRSDGLFRTLVAADGAPLSDDATLYDQAFTLLGLAHAYKSLRNESIRECAQDLLELLHARLSHTAGGFVEGDPRPPQLTSNSHMHLLEAALAWLEVTGDTLWRTLASALVELALTRFRTPDDPQIREFFIGDWEAAPGVDGRIVEPGHQYEWAWLLLRWSVRTSDAAVAAAAYALIDKAEERGLATDRGVAVNSLLADGTVREGRARLWPQTERLKAACIAARLSGEPRYWSAATQAANGVLKYLDVPIAGLWRDTMAIDGTFLTEPAPASSFYHLVCAIVELEQVFDHWP